MVFKSVRVGSFVIRYEPFDDGDEQYPMVDKDKTQLEYVKGTRTNGYYIHPITKEIVSKTYMLVNGEAKEKFEATKEVDKFKFVGNKEPSDLVNPKMYVVECDILKAEMKANNTALKFAFTFGGKSKPYYAIVCLNTIVDKLEMWLSKKKKSEQYIMRAEQEKDEAKLRDMTMLISGIDKAKIEDLIEL